MANKGLFASAIARLLPATDSVNREFAPAYAYGPQAKLAQLAATGTLADSFYASAETHLAEALEAARARGECRWDYIHCRGPTSKAPERQRWRERRCGFESRRWNVA